LFTIAIFAAPAILVLVSESPLIFTFGKSLSFLIAVVLSIIISAAIAIPLLPNYGNALVCVSCFLLQLELCILILPCDGYYGLAILAVLLLIVVVALLQPMLQHAVKKCVLSPLRWRYISKKWPQSGGRRRWSALGQSIPTTTRPCNLWRLAAHQGFYKLHSRACQRGQILVLLHHCSLPLYGGGYNSESCVSIPCHLPLHPVRSPPRQHGYRRLNPSCAFCRSGSTPQVVKYSNHKDMHAHHALRVCVVTDRVMHCMASVCMLW